MRVLAFLLGAAVTAVVLLAVRPAPNPVLASVPLESELIEAETAASLPTAEGGSAPVPARAQRFRAELRAFAADIERTRKVDKARARELATVAVTEAYRHGIPPALVLGVLMVENPELKSAARSSAGATGLMQVMPNVWLDALGPRYGWDLTDDRVNIAMGVHILALYYANNDRDWRKALLRYNGCVRGTRTPNCFEYPDWVRKHTERYATNLCARTGFDGCVTQRLYREFDDRHVAD